MIAKISLFWKCMVPENANLCSERRLLIYSFVMKHKTVFIGKNIQHNIAHKTTLIREKIPQNLNKTDIYMVIFQVVIQLCIHWQTCILTFISDVGSFHENQQAYFFWMDYRYFTHFVITFGRHSHYGYDKTDYDQQMCFQA